MTVQIINGDCRDVLATLPDQSVNCIVTSPPYFGLRDYGVDGQIGLEPTPAEFVAELVAVFREARRVLRDDGTLWLNLGDSYAGSGRGAWNISDEEKDAKGVKETYRPKTRAGGTGIGTTANLAATTRGVGDDRNYGLKPKDLIGIPWRVAFALQDDGWYLRQDIIWHKPNPMPESVRDRCTKSHEYLFLLSKSERYLFDAEAIAEARVGNEDANTFRGGAYVQGEIDNGTMGKRRVPGNKTHKGKAAYEDGDEKHRTKLGLVAYSERERAADPTDMGKRNKRSVWTVATQPFSDAHFATFPPDLIQPCIMAGCPLGGTVLDPFGGAGTTGLVADRLQRNAILIELNPEYATMARNRVTGDAGLFAEVGT